MLALKHCNVQSSTIPYLIPSTVSSSIFLQAASAKEWRQSSPTALVSARASVTSVITRCPVAVHVDCCVLRMRPVASRVILHTVLWQTEQGRQWQEQLGIQLRSATPRRRTGTKCARHSARLAMAGLCATVICRRSSAKRCKVYKSQSIIHIYMYHTYIYICLVSLSFLLYTLVKVKKNNKF